MFVIVCIILVLCPREASEGAREGIKTALEVVLPSILPFAVVSASLIYSGFAKRLAEWLSPVFGRALKLNPYGAAAFIGGLLGGYPTGCKIVCDMYDEGLIDSGEAEKILAYSNNGGIVFAINICGIAAFGSWKKGLFIYAAGAVSALLAGVVLSKSEKRELAFEKPGRASCMTLLGKGIASGGSVIINVVSAFVVFYAVINALRLDKIPLISGMVEITRGIILAGEMNNLPLAAFFFSFGGICVFAQSAALCARGELGLKRMFLGKCISSMLAFVITHVAMSAEKLGKVGAMFSFLAAVAIICSVQIIKKGSCLAERPLEHSAEHEPF